VKQLLLSLSVMFSSANRGAKSLWHRKVKWMLRKVILNPPTSQGQMRTLCSAMIERRHGVYSPPTAAIVTTAISLWDDPNLVGALENNPTYRSARERIHRTASHIMPTSSLTSSKRVSLLMHSQEVLEKQYQDALQCPVCGLKLKCLHEHQSHHMEQDVEEFGKFTEGTAGRVPEEQGETVQDTPTQPAKQIDWEMWFGPLVVTTFAVFGLALGIWSGEIVLPKVRSLSLRAVLAVTMIQQASTSLFKLIH